MSQEFALRDIVGQSAALRAQIAKARRYARCQAAVLIVGETGTGKELFARMIHYLGARSSQPFLPVNCGALPAELMENEFFGHESEAFTGARRSHKGLIGQAEGGTLFLDEIEALLPPTQTKLLRFLQDRKYRPLGGDRSRTADVRIISASNAELASLIRAGQFRQDLYYRLNVLTLNLPALRERREDIPSLAKHLLARLSQEAGKAPSRFSPAAMNKLIAHEWPGNVRELENVIVRATELAEGRTIEERDLDLPIAPPALCGHSLKAQKARLVHEFEVRYLQEALAKYNGNISQAANAAGKERRTFFELLRKHNLLSLAHLSGASVGTARTRAGL